MAPLVRMHPPHPRLSTRLRPIVLATLVVLAPAALAWQAPDAPARIEDRMTATEFRAAGLHQLSEEQLANLNAWLDGERPSPPAAAPAPAQPQPFDDRSRSSSREPVTAHLAGTFDGFGKGRHYTLDNGQVWVQIDDAALPGVTLDHPRVEIRPALIGSAWYLQVDGYNTRAKVRRVE